MKDSIFNLTLSDTIILIVGILIFWSIIKSLFKSLFKKKKAKVIKEYEVTVHTSSDAVYYGRKEILKVKQWGKKNIIIHFRNGRRVEYEGFSFVVITYIIPGLTLKSKGGAM